MMIKATLMIVAAIACIVVASLLHGQQIDRWGVSPVLQQSADRLDLIPATIGDWVGVDVPLDRGSLEVANVLRSMCRQYQNRLTGESINAVVVCGRPGHVAAHPPDVCYAASGYVVGNKQPRNIAGFGTFWEADFTRSNNPSQTLQILWGWGLGRDWLASGTPRLEFARNSYLYKVYLIRNKTAPDDNKQSPFVNLFLSECQRILPPPAS